ncbi:MAG: radical SAM protein, partial [Firmicutes bacterium]|nr:radical SAM protein [Bacillota bacterium]
VARVLKLNPYAKIIIVGCSSQNSAAAYGEKAGVIAVFGATDKDKKVAEAAAELIDDCESGLNLSILEKSIAEPPRPRQRGLRGHPSEGGEFMGIPPREGNCPDCHARRLARSDGESTLSRTRAYVKIQDGCDNFCSFCIVPYLRGRSRSRPLSDIIGEIKSLSKKTKEIVLTGIDISSYGLDNRTSLAQLIRSIGDNLKYGIEPSADRNLLRLRLGSLECGVITEELLTAMREAGFCDHFHVSLQSGSGSVLKRMNRHYTPREFLEKIELIRKYFPYAGVATDVIAGFADETQIEHDETKQFLCEAAFSDLHVFSYSPRKGTKAYDLPQVEKKTREERAREIGEIKNALKSDFIQKNLGRVVEVYAEKDENGFITGFTSNYIRVYTNLRAGEMGRIRLVREFKDGAIGE